MANILSSAEVGGLRKDIELLLGIDENDRSDRDDARTTLTIYRPDTDAIFDLVSLSYTKTPDTIYTGPAIIAPMVFRRDRSENAGEDQMRVRVYRCIVPWDAGNILIDDYVEVDQCDDPNITGRKFWVTDVMYESELAGRRITLTDVTRDQAE